MKDKREDRPYLGISQGKAAKIILGVFKNLSHKNIAVVIDVVKKHGDCWCEKCLKIRRNGVSFDIAMTTIGCLKKEFRPKDFDKLIKSAKRSFGHLFAELQFKIAAI